MDTKKEPTRPGPRTVYMEAGPLTYELLDATELGGPIGSWFGKLKLAENEHLITAFCVRPANVDAAMVRLISVHHKRAVDAECERAKLESWNRGEPKRYDEAH